MTTIHERRFSTLIPWKVDTSNERNTRTPEQQQPVIGWTLEERITRGSQDEYGQQYYQVSVGWGEKELIDNNKKPVSVIRIPFVQKDQQDTLGSTLWPTSLAGAILSHSPAFQRMMIEFDADVTTTDRNVIELGCGLGLKGLAFMEAVAAATKESYTSVHLHLTDNDKDALESLRNIRGEKDFETDFLDWTDIDENFIFRINTRSQTKELDALSIDGTFSTTNQNNVVIGSDVAYYGHLQSPLLKAITEMNPATVFITGQAHRQSLWDLYKAFQNYWYNPLTDAYDNQLRNDGVSQMFLYRLNLGSWEISTDMTTETETEEYSCDATHPTSTVGNSGFFQKGAEVTTNRTTTTDNSGGTIPIAAIVYQKTSKNRDIIPFKFCGPLDHWDHLATNRDKEDLYIN